MVLRYIGFWIIEFIYRL